MKRIDKIYNYIVDRTAQLEVNDLKGKVGFSTQEISHALGILRNNVSMELNTLFKNNKVVKIIGRPVLFLDKNSLENKLKCNIKGPIEITSIEDIIGNSNTVNEEKSPFDNLIGAKTGLKNQVEQAKAAILYPPNGLQNRVAVLRPRRVGSIPTYSRQKNIGKY